MPIDKKLISRKITLINYDEIDAKKVFAAMVACLKDVPKYLKNIVKSLGL